MPVTDFQLGHGTAKFQKADKIAAMKREGKSGRDNLNVAVVYRWTCLQRWTASSNYNFYWINHSDIWGFQVQAGGKGVRCLESKSKLTVGVRSIETCAHGESPSPSCGTRLWEGRGWSLIPLTPAIKLISNPFSPLWTNPKPNPEGFWHDGFSGPWSTRNSSCSCSDLTGLKIPNSP